MSQYCGRLEMHQNIWKDKVRMVQRKGKALTLEIWADIASWVLHWRCHPVLAKHCNITKNKKAISVCGWYPPNMKLFKHTSFVTEPSHSIGKNQCWRWIASKADWNGQRRQLRRGSWQGFKFWDVLLVSARYLNSLDSECNLHFSNPRLLDSLASTGDNLKELDMLKRKSKSNKSVSVGNMLQEKMVMKWLTYFNHLTKYMWSLPSIQEAEEEPKNA